MQPSEIERLPYYEYQDYEEWFIEEIKRRKKESKNSNDKYNNKSFKTPKIKTPKIPKPKF